MFKVKYGKKFDVAPGIALYPPDGYGALIIEVTTTGFKGVFYDLSSGRPVYFGDVGGSYSLILKRF